MKLEKFTRILNLVSAILVLIPIVSIAAFYTTRKDAPAKVAKDTAKTSVANSENMPDIYVITLDAYASNDTLKDYYNYDNGDFLKKLEEKGFWVNRKSVVNYNRTILSIASFFNMTYLDEIRKKVGRASTDWSPLMKLKDNSKVWKLAKKKNYKLVSFYTGFDTVGGEIRNVDYFLGRHLKHSLDDLEQLLLESTPLPRIFQFLGISPDRYIFRKRTKFAFDNLTKLDYIEGNKFVYAHIMCPHEPYMFTENGEKPRGDYTLFNNFRERYIEAITRQGKGDEMQKRYKNGYVNQVKYVNKMILKIVEELFAQSKRHPVIILQSDHGPKPWCRFSTKREMKEMFGNLCVIYFPDRNYQDLYQGITPINYFRAVMNKYFDTDYDYLPDRCYYAPKHQEIYDYIDVTEKLK